MKLENYRKQDIEESIETRREALHHLMEVEKHLWTDDIEEAIKRTVDMHLALVKLSRMQSVKCTEDKFNRLYKHLNAHGIHVQMIHFRQEKTD